MVFNVRFDEELWFERHFYQICAISDFQDENLSNNDVMWM